MNCLSRIFALVALSGGWCEAVFTFDVSTSSGANPTITGGSWTGDGAVQPDVAVGPIFDGDVLVDDFTSGTFRIDGSALGTNGRITTGSGVSHTITFTGGTGDLVVINSNGNDGGSLLFNNMTILDLMGVTSISIVTKYDDPIAGRNIIPTSKGGLPMGMSLGLNNAGTGLGLDSFQVTYSLGNLVTSTDGTNFNLGASGAMPFSNGWDSVVGGQSTFTASDFPGLSMDGDRGDLQLWVRSYDLDGEDGPTSGDAELAYANTFTFTITPDSGTFAADTVFLLSMDGQQYGNVGLVPEPSVVALVSILGAGFVLRRRRRD
ncbi:MAG: PEP-CTERM sorting domain-containing protein [Verrucomicrobiota bacterium]